MTNQAAAIPPSSKTNEYNLGIGCPRTLPHLFLCSYSAALHTCPSSEGIDDENNVSAQYARAPSACIGRMQAGHAKKSPHRQFPHDQTKPGRVHSLTSGNGDYIAGKVRNPAPGKT